MHISFISVLLALSLLTGCSRIPPVQERTALAENIAQSKGWTHIQAANTPLPVSLFQPAQRPLSNHLRVYIEGDGFAWINRTTPSPDPTPINPTGLKLALSDPAGTIAYLARPCMFLPSDAEKCHPRYWTSHRFSPPVIDTMSRVLDQIKAGHQSKELTLVGYSGGAAIALLLAAQRTDVATVITVAGNLDHATWTQHHAITPLSGSLNPAHHTSLLQQVAQWHFVGSQDSVIPPPIAESYINRFPEHRRPTIEIIEGFNHQCCWAEHWVELLDHVPSAPSLQ